MGPTFLELAQQALSSTVEGYDLIAPKFDESPFRTPEPVLKALRDHIGNPADALDVGCGTGDLLEVLAPLCSGRVVGLDFSPGMLRVARQRLGSRVELLLGDILHYTAREEFDVVTCFGMFGHILPQHHRLMLQRIHDALRPGGRLVCIVSDLTSVKRSLYWSARAFDTLMRVRNFLIKPQFVMYYLAFVMPRALELMREVGLEPVVHADQFPKPFHRLRLVVATRQGRASLGCE